MDILVIYLNYYYYNVIVSKSIILTILNVLGLYLPIHDWHTFLKDIIIMSIYSNTSNKIPIIIYWIKFFGNFFLYVILRISKKLLRFTFLRLNYTKGIINLIFIAVWDLDIVINLLVFFFNNMTIIIKRSYHVIR